MDCGFVSYPNRYKSKEELIKFYEDNYRKTVPNSSSIFTGERKIHYHGHFLEDLFKSWKDQKKENPVLTDIGSALGMFLNFVRGIFPKAEVLGVDLTESFSRNAWHLFKIKTVKEFDDSKKYDLISSYRSLEHILDPDIEMTRYIDALKDDGHLYLSIPIWFDVLHNFGMRNGFDIEYYYSPEHINTWSRKHIEGLIGVCGGQIVKENRTYYDTTYLIKKAGYTNKRDVCKVDPQTVLDQLAKVKKASDALEEKRFKDAVEIWPNFPTAWATNYEFGRKEYHKLGFDWTYENVALKAIKSCPDSADMQYFAADLCARYDRYEKAIDHLKISNEMCPNSPNVFSLLASCFRTMAARAKTDDDKIKFLEQSRKTAGLLKDFSIQYFSESMNWIMYDNSQIPTPFEEAVQGSVKI